MSKRARNPDVPEVKLCEPIARLYVDLGVTE